MDNYKDYADLFAVVFQDFNLFSFSIAENVASNGTYDEAKVTDCLNRAGFAERLAKLEKELAELKTKCDSMKMQWQNEKQNINKAVNIKEQLEYTKDFSYNKQIQISL